MMINNSIKIFLYVLGTILVLFGMFIYWASREIPLPINAKKVGDMIHIDISEGATDEAEKAQASFVVPERFKPKVSDSLFAFYFKYPDMTPYSGNESPVPLDSVRVVIKHYVKASALPSESTLRRTQPRDGLLKNVPYFVEKKDGLEIYQYDYGSNKKTIGTYLKFSSRNGNVILLDDPGEWSHAYTIYGKLSSHIGLTYLVPKQLIRYSVHLEEDITAVDNIVFKLAQTFQSK